MCLNFTWLRSFVVLVRDADTTEVQILCFQFTSAFRSEFSKTSKMTPFLFIFLFAELSCYYRSFTTLLESYLCNFGLSSFFLICFTLSVILLVAKFQVKLALYFCIESVSVDIKLQISVSISEVEKMDRCILTFKEIVEYY